MCLAPLLGRAIVLLPMPDLADPFRVTVVMMRSVTRFTPRLLPVSSVTLLRLRVPQCRLRRVIVTADMWLCVMLVVSNMPMVPRRVGIMWLVDVPRVSRVRLVTACALNVRVSPFIVSQRYTTHTRIVRSVVSVPSVWSIVRMDAHTTWVSFTKSIGIVLCQCLLAVNMPHFLSPLFQFDFSHSCQLFELLRRELFALCIVSGWWRCSSFRHLLLWRVRSVSMPSTNLSRFSLDHVAMLFCNSLSSTACMYVPALAYHDEQNHKNHCSIH